MSDLLDGHWTNFQIEAETDVHGVSRITKRHNALVDEVQHLRKIAEVAPDALELLKKLEYIANGDGTHYCPWCQRVCAIDEQYHTSKCTRAFVIAQLEALL
jgi:hypothetical protein